MRRLIEAAALEIVPHGHQHQPTEFQLPCRVEALVQTALVDRDPAALDALEERNELGPQLRKQRRDLRDGGAGLVEVEQGVVGRRAVPQILRFFPFEADKGDEMRGESARSDSPRGL